METTTKKQTKKEQAIDWLVNNKPKTSKEAYKDIIIVKHSLCCVAIWEFKSHKPTYHYIFDNASKVENFIAERKKKADRRAEQQANAMNEYAEKSKDFIVGAILYSSWGWEQTNIDWYIILERKGDYIIIQEIGSIKSYDNNFNDRGECMPNPEIKIGEPFRKKITKYASVNLASYKYCGLWDGKSKSWSSYA